MYTCLWCNAEYENIPTNGICPQCHHNQFKELKMTHFIKPGGLILKLSSVEVIDSMRKGNIWFNSPKYYQEFKGNPAICDLHECAFDYIKYVDGEPVGKESSTQNYNRLLCLYLLRMDKEENIAIPDERIKSFGDYFSVVDIGKLQKTISAWCKVKGYEYNFTGVKYNTTNYEGDYNPTFKDCSYSYQNEFRFIIGLMNSINFLKRKLLRDYLKV